MSARLDPWLKLCFVHRLFDKTERVDNSKSKTNSNFVFRNRHTCMLVSRVQFRPKIEWHTRPCWLMFPGDWSATWPKHFWNFPSILAFKSCRKMICMWTRLFSFMKCDSFPVTLLPTSEYNPVSLKKNLTPLSLNTEFPLAVLIYVPSHNDLQPSHNVWWAW